jgi:hypothetical protein
MRIDAVLLGIAAIITGLGVASAIIVASTLNAKEEGFSFEFSSRALAIAAVILVVSGVPCCLGIGFLLCVWVGILERRLNWLRSIRCDFDPKVV